MQCLPYQKIYFIQQRCYRKLIFFRMAAFFSEAEIAVGLSVSAGLEGKQGRSQKGWDLVIAALAPPKSIDAPPFRTYILIFKSFLCMNHINSSLKTF